MKKSAKVIIRRIIGTVLASVLISSLFNASVRAAQLTTLIDNMKPKSEEAAAPEATTSGGEADQELKVTISAHVLVIQVDNVNRLYAKVTKGNKEIRYPVSWESDHPEIVSVAEDGSLAGLSPGTAHITVSIADENGTQIDVDICAVAIIPNGDLSEMADKAENWTWKGFYRAMSHLEGARCPWKQILCIGDSVTAGVQAGPGRLAWIPNYPLAMAYYYNVPVYNRGVGGSSIWSQGNFTIIDSLDTYEKADAVFLMGGYNDWFYGTRCAIGDLETPGTFTYDFNALCDRIEELYGNADIFVILPSTPHAHMGIEPYYDFSWLKSVERKVAESHNFFIINLPAENILNGLEQDTWETFFSDNVHMNDLGYIVLGTYIADKALEIKRDSE
ncbi:MAG: Ig-like domain-containing protein [Lachnospiraceae bacterium]|nr:Ig-like domain-containing protein [Lachnospiraceae bacterium]